MGGVREKRAGSKFLSQLPRYSARKQKGLLPALFTFTGEDQHVDKGASVKNSACSGATNTKNSTGKRGTANCKKRRNLNVWRYVMLHGAPLFLFIFAPQAFVGHALSTARGNLGGSRVSSSTTACSSGEILFDVRPRTAG